MRKIGSSMMLLVFIMTAIFMTACTQLASLETQESAAIDTPAENNITEEDLVIDKLNYTEDGRVNLEIYRHSSSKEPLPAIISLPGGAFGFLADTDKDPTAMTFYERGFQAFVLNYSVGEYSGFPAPLDEVSWAIWQIRSHADAWNVDPDKIVVMGFSAGVSVAGMSATQWNTPGLYERVGAPDGESIRPNAAVMGYGACDTSGTIVDNPDVVNPGIWGKIVTDRTPELDYLYYIDEKTSPMFIWQPEHDQYVPKENQRMLAEALEKANVVFELHMFQDGYHGMSVGYNAPGYDPADSPHPDADRWVELCVDWLSRVLG